MLKLWHQSYSQLNNPPDLHLSSIDSTEIDHAPELVHHARVNLPVVYLLDGALLQHPLVLLPLEGVGGGGGPNPCTICLSSRCPV